MEEHYSSRLKRNYQDGDLLSVPEVLEVIAANSGREVSDRALADIARTKQLTRERPSPRAVLYHYDQVKNLVVSSSRGRRMHDHPSPTALRQRKYKQQRRKADTGDDQAHWRECLAV